MAKQLLVALDTNEATDKILAYIAPLASRLDEMRLQLVTVAVGVPADSQELAALHGAVPDPELHGDVDHRDVLQALEQFLSDAVAKLKAAGVPADKITTQLLPDQRGVAADLLEKARELGCDTLVIGRRHAAGLHHLLLGSTSEQLVEDAVDLTLWVVT
jgi:nucleotide-binding universal stress UspA family protein